MTFAPRTANLLPIGFVSGGWRPASSPDTAAHAPHTQHRQHTHTPTHPNHSDRKCDQAACQVSPNNSSGRWHPLAPTSAKSSAGSAVPASAAARVALLTTGSRPMCHCGPCVKLATSVVRACRRASCMRTRVCPRNTRSSLCCIYSATARACRRVLAAHKKQLTPAFCASCE